MQNDYYYVLGIMILYADLQVTLSFFVCTHVCYLHLRVSLYIFLEHVLLQCICVLTTFSLYFCTIF